MTPEQIKALRLESERKLKAAGILKATTKGTK